MKFIRKIPKPIKIIFLCIFILFFLYLAIQKCVNEYKEYQLLKDIPSGITIEEAEQMLKEEDSDIEGLSLYDKMEMKLDTRDGSDTDQDGLTDKEEIEIYHTDPLNPSTANDMYTDGYKVENGLDPLKKYEYDGEVSFEGNECPEVKLDKNTPVFYNVVVKDVTGYTNIDGVQIYKEYNVYNYSGEDLVIDVSDILQEYNISTKDLSVLTYDWNELKKESFSADDNSITIKKSFDLFYDYSVFIVEKLNEIDSLTLDSDSISYPGML